jgi:DNA-directed RNA polymerase specialized sigma24 family protein
MQQNLLEQATGGSIAERGQHQSAVQYNVASSMQSSVKFSPVFATQDVSTTCCIEEIVEKYDPYICALAWRSVHGTYTWIRSDLLEEKVYDLAQRSRIKFWQSLRQRTIENPKAYIRQIIRTEAVDMMRQQLRAIPLSLTEEGELYHGRLLVERSEGMNDPAIEAEQRETVDHRMSSVVAAVVKLPPRQQKVMICFLKEKFGNFNLLTEICKKWNIDLDAIAWPEGVEERHRLKACVAPAKKKIRLLISER